MNNDEATYEETVADADKIVNALKEDKKKEEDANKAPDISCLKGDKRLPDEKFEDYKSRIKREKKLRKKYMKGNTSWGSMFQGTYKNAPKTVEKIVKESVK